MKATVLVDRVIGGHHREARVRRPRPANQAARRRDRRGRVAPIGSPTPRARALGRGPPALEVAARSGPPRARAGTSAQRALDVAASSVRPPRASGSSCLGRAGGLHGQNRSPRPPARISTNRSGIGSCRAWGPLATRVRGRQGATGAPPHTVQVPHFLHPPHDAQAREENGHHAAAERGDRRVHRRESSANTTRFMPVCVPPSSSGACARVRIGEVNAGPLLDPRHRGQPAQQAGASARKWRGSGISLGW